MKEKKINTIRVSTVVIKDLVQHPKMTEYGFEAKGLLNIL